MTSPGLFKARVSDVVPPEPVSLSSIVPRRWKSGKASPLGMISFSFFLETELQPLVSKWLVLKMFQKVLSAAMCKTTCQRADSVTNKGLSHIRVQLGAGSENIA